MVAAVVVALVSVIAILTLNPLRASEDVIRERILKATPTGTSMEEVIDIIDSQEAWELLWIDSDKGFSAQWTHLNYTVHRDGRYIVGEKSIKVFLGEYFSLRTFCTPVSVFWGFDEKGILVDVQAIKEADIALW